ncbi:molybdenum cofactor guanylyltransferase [Haloimpatiens sp. FM7330]|uniref:molybdenum cofactor guanylyltransferase n=1 Tax=Haloimpatiens sp. FM7330 TaxID=3298610 RepID=UPI00363C2CE3
MCEKIDGSNKFKTAVILAGGKSSRMGFDKQILKIGNKTVMESVIEKLKKEFEEIIIVTNKPELYTNSPYKIVCDEIKEKGPLSGIHVGLKESSSKYAYFIACDMPNVNIQYIRYMKSKIKNIQVDACVTENSKRIEPFNAFYCKSIIPKIEIQILKNKRSMRCLMSRINVLCIDEKEALQYSSNLEMFKNLNTIDDVVAYKKINRALNIKTII